MNENPQVLPTVPAIPRDALWAVLSVPPVTTLVANLAISLASNSGEEATGGLILVPIVMFFVILILTIRFREIIAPTYRGRSIAFLSFVYFFGQIVLCLALWIA